MNVAVSGATHALYSIDRSVSETAASLTLGSVDSSTSWIEERDSLIRHLAEHYSGLSDAVAKYLRANSDLAWALISAKVVLQRLFGDSVVVRLAVVIDVDTEERKPELFAYIRCALNAEQASESLDRFDTEWFLSRIHNLGGYLAFDLDF